MVQLRDSKGRFTSGKTLDAKVQQKLTKPTTKTHVAIVLDESGSMFSLRRQTQDFYNNLVNTIREQSNKLNQLTTLTLIRFSSTAHVAYTLDINAVKNLAAYSPSGNTVLFDATKLAYETLSKYDNGSDSFLVYVITDGEENRSLTQASVIDQKIGDLQSTNRWTFAFHLPKGYATSFKSRFRISSDNIREWETTEEGLRDVVKTSSEGMVNYYTSRSMGATATKSFFADLSNVKSTDLRQLNDLSGQLQSFEVNKETDIKSFVEDKTGQYTAGIAYYELSKPETVQPSKDILVMERGKKTVYGGQQARQLLGLPNNQTVRLKIQNLSNYRVFVRSDSQNRKLVRGTTVFVKK